MATTALLVLSHLTKRYPSMPVPALNDVSLQVNAGEVYGFLGANGAGKSTAIRTVLNFLQPTSGMATIAGYDSVSGSVAAKRHVGYLAGDVALYDSMNGERFLQYMAGLQPPRDAAYGTQLVRDFEVDVKRPLGTLSKGNRQKVGIIQAFMHQPDVLILDEPTSGLDPLMQEVFFDAVRAAKQRGGCVFFSSHNLAEVQRICDRIGFIRQGRLVHEQSLSELAASTAHTFDITFQSAVPLAPLKTIPGADVSQTSDPHHISIALPANSLPKLFAVLATSKVRQFQQREVNLEEEFLSFYREANHG